MNIIRPVVFSVLLPLTAACLTACGGDSDGVRFAPPEPPPEPPANAGGIWEGTITYDLPGAPVAIVGVVVEDNDEARFVTEEGVALVLESFEGSGGEITAIITAYAPPGATFVDGSTISIGSLSVTVAERSSMNGEWTLDNGDSGTVSLAYDDLYETESSLDRLSGFWLDSFDVLYSVDMLGNIFAQDAFGCVYDGRVRLIDRRFNAYSLAIDIDRVVLIGHGVAVVVVNRLCISIAEVSAHGVPRHGGP